MPYQFVRYDQNSLDQAGQAFLQDIRLAVAANFAPNNRTLWTDLVLDWWAAAAIPPVVVDAKCPQSASADWPPSVRQMVPERVVAGEFMCLDLTHTNFPPISKALPYWSSRYWAQVLVEPREVFLALESEWNLDLHQVLHDASKLALVRARAKVMVFGTWDGSTRTHYVQALERLRTQLSDPAPWLWVDVPAVAPKSGTWAPAWGTFPTNPAAR